jgi:serine/threonine protein kinase
LNNLFFYFCRSPLILLRLPPQTQEIQPGNSFFSPTFHILRDSGSHLSFFLYPFLALSFEQLLAKRKQDIQPGVVARCRRRFGSLVQQAVSENSIEIAQMAYEQSAALPQTNTEHQFLLEGYKLNGPWNNCNENMIICYQGSFVKLLKVLSPKEMERGSTFLAKLQDHTLSEFITPFEIRSVNEKNFMIMPHYAGTLESHPELTIILGIKLFQQMSQAIKFFHNLGMNHMDIKPSNICLRENGNFVLIDLGSVAMKGSYSESTVVYVPRNFQPRERLNPNNRYNAGERNDWLMLGMTIAEKVYGLEIGTVKPPPTIEELIGILRKDGGAFEELITLMSGTDTEA